MGVCTALEVCSGFSNQVVQYVAIAALGPLSGVGTDYHELGCVLVRIDGVGQFCGINKCADECIYCTLKFLVVIHSQFFRVHLCCFCQYSLQVGTYFTHLRVLGLSVDDCGIELELCHVGISACGGDLGTCSIIDVETQILIVAGRKEVACYLFLSACPWGVQSVQQSPAFFCFICQCGLILGAINSHHCDMVILSRCSACYVCLQQYTFGHGLIQCYLEIMCVTRNCAGPTAVPISSAVAIKQVVE